MSVYVWSGLTVRSSPRCRQRARELTGDDRVPDGPPDVMIARTGSGAAGPGRVEPARSDTAGDEVATVRPSARVVRTSEPSSGLPTGQAEAAQAAEADPTGPVTHGPALRLRGGADPEPDIIRSWKRISSAGTPKIRSAALRRIDAAVAAVAREPGSVHRVKGHVGVALAQI